jgi:hypothetical protein
MMWQAVPDEMVKGLFDAGQTYAEIAKRFNTTRNAVAGRCKRLGLVRDRDAAEDREKERDRRDIDILCDLDEGHSQADCAKHYGVDPKYVSNLSVAARSA